MKNTSERGNFQCPLTNQYAPEISNDYIQTVISVRESALFEAVL